MLVYVQTIVLKEKEKMKEQLLQKLRPITEEERKILEERKEIQKEIYTASDEFTIDSRKMLEKGNKLAEFVLQGLRKRGDGPNYLHYRVAEVVPIQNLIENLVWNLLNRPANHRQMNQMTIIDYGYY